MKITTVEVEEDLLPLMAAEDENPPTLHEIHNIEDSASDYEDGDDDSSTSSEDDEPAPTSAVKILMHNKEMERDETFTVLLDSGTSGCIGTEAAVKRAGGDIKPSK